MNSMNVVCLVGRVMRDPETKSLNNGALVAELSIGVSESHQNKAGEWESTLHFVGLVCWDRQAELVRDRVRKGDDVLVQGSLQYESWEAKDGGKRNRLRVRVQRLQKLAGASEEPEIPQAREPARVARGGRTGSAPPARRPAGAQR